MKFKPFLFSTIVSIAAIISMIVFAVFTFKAYKPTVTEKEFPFSITYELDGKTETIEGIYSVSFAGHGGYVDSTFRNYEGTIISQPEAEETSYVLSENADSVITLYTNFQADYLMGDPQYHYFTNEDFAPVLNCYDLAKNDSMDEQAIQKRGIRLIHWEYPEPIENTLVFSHISYMTGSATLPFALICTAALLLIVLFVKKEKEPAKKWIDTVSVIINFVIGLIIVPFLTIFGSFSDITGSHPGFAYQMIYLLPAITLLGLAASVSLRRKGHSKGSFIAQFTGPAVSALVLISQFLIETF